MPSGYSYTDPQSVHNPATGTVPPASWGDTVRDDLQYLNLRGPVICTSSTRPGTPTEGDICYETDTNKMKTYDGTNWWTTGIFGTTFTSTSLAVTQGVSVSTGAATAQYMICNGVCEVWFTQTISSAGTGGNQVILTLPVTSALSTVGITVGNGMIFDASAPRIYPGQWEIVSSTTISLATGDPTGGTSNAPWGAAPSIALASGDIVRGHLRYRISTAA